MAIFSSLYGTRLDRELGSADSTQLFTTARRKGAINEGQMEFTRLTNCLERRTSFAAVSGQSEYDMNSTAYVPDGDFYAVAPRGVEFHYADASSQTTVLAGEDLRQVDVIWLDRYEPGWQLSSLNLTGMQLPQTWFERIGAGGGSHNIGLWPTPSSGSSAAMEVVVTYYAFPISMTSDTNEPFAAVSGFPRKDLVIYHQALVHYAAHQLEKLRRDHEASKSQLQMFLSYVSQYLQATRKKGGNALTFARRYFRTSRSEIVTDPRT